LAMALFGGSATVALADGPVGANPSSNFPLGPLPDACYTDPTGATCVNAGVTYLDKARARLGQPAYVLPRGFDSLSPAEQAFVLTNLDRTLYGLSPIPGLTSALDRDAAGGVASDNDPTPSDTTWIGYTANWAGGYENMVLAYEGWMYDDGPGSGNLDCTSGNTSGCWGHRHDILWRFSGSGALAMGAAAGNDSGGQPSYAMLIEKKAPGVQPGYTYTWAQAVAAGAASPTAKIASSHGSVRIEHVRVHGHRITITTLAPRGATLHCSLVGHTSHGRRVARSKRCGQTVSFRNVPAGRYRLRIASGRGTATRRVTVG